MGPGLKRLFVLLIIPGSDCVSLQGAPGEGPLRHRQAV